MADLSPTMQKALQHARWSGGKLVRHPGGFWIPPDLGISNNKAKKHGLWFGTSTVQALVQRGLMHYSRWKEGRKGKFPIEVEVNNV